MKKNNSQVMAFGGQGRSTAHQVHNPYGITSGKAYRMERVRRIMSDQAEVIHDGFKAICSMIL